MHFVSVQSSATFKFQPQAACEELKWIYKYMIHDMHWLAVNYFCAATLACSIYDLFFENTEFLYSNLYTNYSSAALKLFSLSMQRELFFHIVSVEIETQHSDPSWYISYGRDA